MAINCLSYCIALRPFTTGWFAPLLVFIDEAHQFLNKRIGEETNRFELDAFGNIAKEGRKYGLNTIIATQRPRDIPEDVLEVRPVKALNLATSNVTD
jgi:DNA helicase HerA-like ATPase